MIINGVDRNLDACPRSGRSDGIARPRRAGATLRPIKVDPIPSVPRDRDQGSLASCVEFTICEQLEHLTGKRFSPLYGYYFERRAEGEQPTEDGGLSIPQALFGAHVRGICLESLWPYDETKMAETPPPAATLDAVWRLVTRTDAIADLDELRDEVARGQPVALGFDVPETIFSPDTQRTGIVTTPPGATFDGRHAVNAIAYDDLRGLVGCTSHWGVGFGDRGMLWLPYSMFAEHVADMYAVRGVTGGPPVAVAA